MGDRRGRCPVVPEASSAPRPTGPAEPRLPRPATVAGTLCQGGDLCPAPSAPSGARPAAGRCPGACPSLTASSSPFPRAPSRPPRCHLLPTVVSSSAHSLRPVLAGSAPEVGVPYPGDPLDPGAGAWGRGRRSEGSEPVPRLVSLLSHRGRAKAAGSSRWTGEGGPPELAGAGPTHLPTRPPTGWQWPAFPGLLGSRCRAGTWRGTGGPALPTRPAGTLTPFRRGRVRH